MDIYVQSLILRQNKRYGMGKIFNFCGFCNQCSLKTSVIHLMHEGLTDRFSEDKNTFSNSKYHAKVIVLSYKYAENG